MPRRHDYHCLTVADVIDETADTRSFVFAVPAPLADCFAYAAGQFCTFRATIGGEVILRCYSMSSSPHTGDPFTVTVKRVPGGKMSNWMNDALAAGDTELPRRVQVHSRVRLVLCHVLLRHNHCEVVLDAKYI